MSFLITGGTGHTGAPLAQALVQRGCAVRVGTRAPQQAGQVHFDWLDEQTHEPALAGVVGLYLLAPPLVSDPASIVGGFVQRALARGVRRVVLLSSSAIGGDEPGLGSIERLLRAEVPEWTVLKPSWFMQNFTNLSHHHGRSLAETGQLYTSTGTGRVGFRCSTFAH